MNTSPLRSALVSRGARLALGAAPLAVLCLLLQHVLSPQFDPAVRMVSEYALGGHAWLLATMFVVWGVGSLGLAAALWSLAPAVSGRVAAGLLFVSGIGEVLAAVFDVQHPLHGLAALLGIPTLPIAATLVAVASGKHARLRTVRSGLWIGAFATWGSLLLMVVAMVVMMATMGSRPAGAAPDSLPPGTIAFGGYANRLLVVVYCAWLFTTARALRRGADAMPSESA